MTFARLRARLAEKENDVRARPVIYVAFGDSVTQGCMEYATIEHEQAYPYLLRKLLVGEYPRTTMSVINAGVSGDTATNSRPRWERDLLAFRPDLVTVSFGVNDAHRGADGLAAYREALAELMSAVASETEADVLLLTPTKMMTRDNPHVHPEDRKHIPAFLKVADAGSLPLYADAMRAFAAERNIPLVDIYDLCEQMERQGIDFHTRLANGINHPDRDFHRLMAEALVQRIMADA